MKKFLKWLFHRHDWVKIGECQLSQEWRHYDTWKAEPIGDPYIEKTVVVLEKCRCCGKERCQQFFPTHVRSLQPEWFRAEAARQGAQILDINQAIVNKEAA